jgi:hypothetical protein
MNLDGKHMEINMHNKFISLILSILFVIYIFFFGIMVNIKTPGKISKSERRDLACKPSVSISSISDGTFFDLYEQFLLDQFPDRDGFRRLKSYNRFYIFNQSDNHGIFIQDGYAAKISYPLTEKSENVYIKRLNAINEQYFEGNNMKVYNTIIPDKAYFLADKAGCPKIDYENLVSRVSKNAPGEYIDIFSALSIEDYYKTDTHWSQNRIIPCADRLLSAMGRAINADTYEKTKLSPFYGVYYGESALPLVPDVITCMGSPVIDSAVLTRADKTGVFEDGRIYCDENINADDAYDVFLGGASTVMVIDNTKVNGGRVLYLISDSFGRSLAPLLLSDYDEVIMYDIRYIKMSEAINLAPLYTDSDVLFAYSIGAIDVSSNLQAD